MRKLVVYDSVFGNTERIAQAIAAALGPAEEVEILAVGQVEPEQLTGRSLLVVGSPTRGFRATPAITNLLKRVPGDGLRGTRVAAFDTRFPPSEIAKTAILGFLVRFFGYAAEPIAKRLQKKGGQLAAAPAGFFVAGTQGPLTEGELERAADWARQLAAS